MAVLTAAIDRPMPQAQAKVWFDLLKDLPVASLSEAIARWLSEVNSGFPTIAALRQFAAEAQHGRLPAAADAFGRVCKAIRTIAYEYEPEKFRAFVGPMAFQALGNCGGVSWLADMPADNRTTYSAQFRRAYEAIAARADSDRRLPEALRPRPALDYRPEVRRLAEAMGTMEET